MNVRLSKGQEIKILNTESVYKIMQQVLLRENSIPRSQEHFWVIGLNNANKILFIELVALGVDNRVYVKPTQVFKMAIYKAATKMILAHIFNRLYQLTFNLNYKNQSMRWYNITLDRLDTLLIESKSNLSNNLSLLDGLSGISQFKYRYESSCHS